jgi:hypothetical protein
MGTWRRKIYLKTCHQLCKKKLGSEYALWDGEMYLSGRSYIILSARPVCANREAIQAYSCSHSCCIICLRFCVAVSMCQQHVKCKQRRCLHNLSIMYQVRHEMVPPVPSAVSNPYHILHWLAVTLQDHIRQVLGSNLGRDKVYDEEYHLRVVRVSTDVSEEHVASIFRVEEIISTLTCWFLLKLFLRLWRWRRYVPPKR